MYNRFSKKILSMEDEVRMDLELNDENREKVKKELAKQVERCSSYAFAGFTEEGEAVVSVICEMGELAELFIHLLYMAMSKDVQAASALLEYINWGWLNFLESQ